MFLKFDQDLTTALPATFVSLESTSDHGLWGI